jgi:hypothetical protein
LLQDDETLGDSLAEPSRKIKGKSSKSLMLRFKVNDSSYTT